MGVKYQKAERRSKSYAVVEGRDLTSTARYVTETLLPVIFFLLYDILDVLFARTKPFLQKHFFSAPRNEIFF